MRLPNDLCRCYGNHSGAICPSRDTCARYVQLSSSGYNTPAGMHLCDIRGQTFMPFYIEEKASHVPDA